MVFMEFPFQTELTQSLQMLGIKVRQATEEIATLRQIQSRVDVGHHHHWGLIVGFQLKTFDI
jgi:hypothetical protein